MLKLNKKNKFNMLINPQLKRRPPRQSNIPPWQSKYNKFKKNNKSSLLQK